jgi:hypothetical protein
MRILVCRRDKLEAREKLYKHELHDTYSATCVRIFELKNDEARITGPVIY